MGLVCELSFPRKWWTLLLVSLVAIPPVGMGLAVTWPAVDAWANGRLLSYKASPWWGIVAVDIVLLLALFIVYWIPLVSLLTTFTDEGVSQPGLLRRKSIRWSEVTRLSEHRSTTKISSERETISINLPLFEDPGQLIAEVRRRVPHCAPVW